MKKIKVSHLISICIAMIILPFIANFFLLIGIMTASFFSAIFLQSISIKMILPIKKIYFFLLTFLALEIGIILTAKLSVLNSELPFLTFALIGGITGGIFYAIGWTLSWMISKK